MLPQFIYCPSRNTILCGRVPAANAPGCTTAEGLLLQTVVFSRSYLHRQVSPPETLVVKGGTTWVRKLRLPSKHFRVLLHAANVRHPQHAFFRPEKSDGFGRELGYQRPARYLPKGV